MFTEICNPINFMGGGMSSHAYTGQGFMKSGVIILLRA
jgi:hypothetical protein